LEEHDHRIKEIGEDGEPISPMVHANKFTRQCGVLVRDNIPITIREWKKTKTELKGICPRGNNKVVIILFCVHNRCLFFMLELY
jgi:hypothetical protein